MLYYIKSAVYLGRFHTLTNIPDKIHQKEKYFSFKNSLVVFQFFISHVLVAATLIILKQTNYLLYI